MTSFFIFATLTTLLFIAPTLLPTTIAYNIRDINGKKVINNGTYYIRTNKPGPNEGSITWSYNASSSDQTCPLFVTRGDSNTYAPVSVYSYNGNKYIPLGGQIYITFLDNTTLCSADTTLYWSAMMEEDDITYVVAGYLGDPYDFGFFQIKDSWLKQRYVYKIEYCTDDNGCVDVGWLANGTDPYLVIATDPYDPLVMDPFYFQFVKA